MIKHRLKKLEDKKYLENSEVRRLERIGSQVRNFCEDMGLDSSVYDLSSWEGIGPAWVDALDIYIKKNCYVSKEELDKRQKHENNI